MPTTTHLTMAKSHDIYFNDILKALPIKYEHLNCCQTQQKKKDHKNYYESE